MSTEPKLVLLVDDEPDLLDVMAVSLEAYGLSVVTAGSVSEARAIIAKTAVDVIITDLRMPGTNGREFLRELAGKASDQKRPQIYVSTAYVDMAPHEAKALGVKGILQKPFNFDELMTTIDAQAA